MKASNKFGSRFAAALAVAVLLGAPVQAHHSFAMYDLRVTKVFTGVVTRVDPAPNHMGIFFAPMNAERKNVERDAAGEPIVWSVEMGGSAQMARQGVFGSRWACTSARSRSRSAGLVIVCIMSTCS